MKTDDLRRLNGYLSKLDQWPWFKKTFVPYEEFLNLKRWIEKELHDDVKGSRQFPDDKEEFAREKLVKEIGGH